jgi:hypothetical protein
MVIVHGLELFVIQSGEAIMKPYKFFAQLALTLFILASTIDQALSQTSQAVLALQAGGAGTAASLGPDGKLQAGYATTIINSGSTPYATAVFSYVQNGIVLSEVGVPASPPTLAARLFVEVRTGVPSGAGTIAVNTGIAAVIEGAATATIKLVLRDLQGNTISTGSVQLAASGHFAKFVDQFAPDFVLPGNFSSGIWFGSLEITSDQPISILPLRMTTNQRGDSLFTSTPIADMSSALGTTSLDFPQIADGADIRLRFCS